jgi:hypothetical protein
MLLWTLLATAWGGDLNERSYFGKSLGWSPDGRYVAVEMVTDQYSRYHHYGDWRWVRAWDTWTGEERQYKGEVTLNPDPPDDEGEPTTVPPPASWEGLPPVAELGQFAAALTGDGAVDGCGEANLQGRLDGAPAMEGSASLRPEPNGVWLHADDASTLVTLVTRRSGRDWPVYTYLSRTEDRFDSAYLPQGGWRWVYAPNCSRAVLVSHVAGDEGSRDGYEPAGATAEVEIIALGPRVDVMAHTSHQALVEPAAQILAQKGWAVRLAPAAKARRAETAVYAWSRAREAAEAVASALPGGPKVEKLSWKTPADVVVALGSPD